ncbi:hypothetical protein Salat_0653000 [Sesamum alatum]|uniref:Uncharacterized protein n=1 Tax=Sesamum alatum TaxID=300844 RepID=A0AAE2CUB5_9LAMI|nr:hypothetical protein Salat_0653000 [Sesamum alatum]
MAADADDHPPSIDLSTSPSCLEDPQTAAPLVPPSPVVSSPSTPACLPSRPSSSAGPSPPFADGSSYVDVLKGLTHQPIPKPLCTAAIAHRQEHVEHFVDSAMAYPGMVQPLVHDVCSPTVNASAPLWLIRSSHPNRNCLLARRPRVIDHGATALPPPDPVDKGKSVFISNSFEALNEVSILQSMGPNSCSQQEVIK